LKDYLVWEYKAHNKKEVFINDNQTIIGNNHSAWQLETSDSFPLSNGEKETMKNLYVLAAEGNTGYMFLYRATSDNHFDRYLDGFKNMLKSVKLTSQPSPKTPSFMNSSLNANTSNIGNSMPILNKSHPVTILSHNSSSHNTEP